MTIVSCGAGAAVKEGSRIPTPIPTVAPQVGDFMDINPRDYSIMMQMKINAEVWATTLQTTINSYVASKNMNGKWDVDWNKGRFIYLGPENVTKTAGQ